MSGAKAMAGAALGTPVVINVGDQLTDVEGGAVVRGFLLPNPMYRLK